MAIAPTLNVPQAKFLAMQYKFKAYVAGFGCLRGSTPIVTEFGIMPIQEITRPMRVLSWSAENNRFELSLSGGAYPKGVANLYRIVTQRGEFVASGHHRILCADGSYRSVDSLDESVKVFASSQSLLLTSLASVPKSLHAGDQRLNQKLADCLGRYADEARRYGQLLLSAADNARVSSQQSYDALISDRYGAHVDALLALEQWHTHPDQQYGRRESRDFAPRFGHLEVGAQHCEPGERFERAFPCNQPSLRSLLTFCSHQQEQEFCLSRFPAGLASDAVSGLVRTEIYSGKHGCGHNQLTQPLLKQCGLDVPNRKLHGLEASKLNSLIETCNILSVSRLSKAETYFDLQVLDNNCYVTADGAIHHNSGKTWVGCGGICKGMWEHPKINQGYFAPTYPQIRDIFYPTVEEVAYDWGLNVKINEGNKEVHFYAGKQFRGTTICRSMEKPHTIVGFKIGNALIDELDVMPAKKAQLAWRKIIARMRYNVPGLRNGIDVTTTPEGFKFVYQQFAKAVRDKPSLSTLYGLVQASTFDNEKNLPADYIPSLMESYPPELIKAYLRGQFTNLSSGTIYHQFDRQLNNCQEEEQPGEPLYIGMDFNVGKMAGIVHVLRLGLPCAVTEIIKAYDTPDIIRIIKERFWLYDGHDYRKVREIYIYPDASGDSRKSAHASTTDIAQLKQAGFNVIVNDSNPPVKDRINSMNAMFCNGNGERRYKVNVKRCPVYTESLEQQVWGENGEPDKKADNDHPNDAGGYFIVKQFPIIKPTGKVTKLRM